MLKPPQRWAVIAAWVAVAAGLLPVIWRLHMLVWGAGWSPAPEFQHGGRLFYVLGLIAVETIASLLVLGLVQPWGERIAGRRIPPGLVVAIAATGATVVSLIIAVTDWQLVALTLQGISNPVTQVEAGWKRAFMLAHYAPWVLWPIGLWVAIVAFARRHWA
ncbi:hypothetical protein ACQB6R_03845 [Propionibacteriaceae bacterium G1746]